MFDLTPFRKMSEDLFEQIAKSFNEAFEQTSSISPLSPSVHSFRTDVMEKEDAYYVVAELPGFTKDDITIEVEDNRLIIRAKRDEVTEERDDTNKYIRKERRYGEFVRQFYVDDIDENGIKAKLDNGILKLEIPKLQPSKPKRRTIEIE
ncbi:Hsp20/alpha crystallin family protein [Fervidibacillus halotolerans]|uniref:Hsp20/alpha crystallin family protein n=1 Tax=Fervidibacillus halotolerans TaxID=2980027 RepID=A0A9E8RZW4_9BACI|nr:Hsp20/alpha crystallin family protein [Fervidibacillus halotolerans]WAA12047.1 Hsp20/alpha crystallin family protein [Fervidibacillus halotolerans]